MTDIKSKLGNVEYGQYIWPDKNAVLMLTMKPFKKMHNITEITKYLPKKVSVFLSNVIIGTFMAKQNWKHANFCQTPTLYTAISTHMHPSTWPSISDVQALRLLPHIPYTKRKAAWIFEGRRRKMESEQDRVRQKRRDSGRSRIPQRHSGKEYTVQGNAWEGGNAEGGREEKRQEEREVEVSGMCSFPCGLFACWGDS